MIPCFLDGLRRWSDFKGRSTRSDYWWFLLGMTLCYFVLAHVMVFTISLFGTYSMIFPFGGLAILLVPLIAVTVRRLHDTGKSGWYFLLTFIPLLGGILHLIFMIQVSQRSPNKWGPIPGEEDEDDEFVNSLVGDNELLNFKLLC